MDPAGSGERAGSRLMLEVEEHPSLWLVAVVRITFAWLVTLLSILSLRPTTVAAGDKTDVKLVDRRTGGVVWRSTFRSDDETLEATTEALRRDLAELDVLGFASRWKVRGFGGP